MNKIVSGDETGAKAGATPDLAAVLAASARQNKRGRWRGRLLILLIILAAAAGAAYFYAGRGESEVSYATQPAKRGDLTVLVTATGSVQPTEQVDISSELSGTVRDVNVDYNSTIKAGDVLALLDTNKLEADVKSSRAKVNSAKANVAKANADLESASTSLERLKSLVRSNVSTQQSLDDATYKYDSAVAAKQINEAEVLASEADLQLAEVNLAKAKIVSPIDGVILTRSVNPGATVAASLSAPILFTIAGDLKKMELQVDVDEADVGKIAVGQKAKFTVDAYPDRSFPAEIEQIRFASEVVNNVVTYKAVLSVDNADLLLRPGMTATADITVEAVKDTLMVPNAALRYAPPQAERRGRGILGIFGPPRRRGGNSGEMLTGAQRRVWVLRNGRAAPVIIQVGSSDGQFTQVVSGDLKADDALVTDATVRTN
ncbi:MULTISPECIES: efflux RND transporter periplasmic adaptor subunit [Rhizobium]|uniref:efflux RND transporter periplasmic adaptor subunit n=1 Tax=Rhizobium TaxID=379 RepID=UPI0007EA6564|nr:MULTISPECIES: efflux RND transporter periplasmic adaptor subunit [Rhizobium]ANK91632.1 RND family efflux transporter protein [Rhizobium sp. N6212]ANK97666.1 RND family efflux transporter protein [Rhizobium sp. N621]ANL03745.1 RND family efflux transporter protein [Rhizobium esperanzae]ANL09791.1 RND family efflux transporter protein [Rhizobium sp. N1341]ANL21843.1 RND family efflux transporter protein [Rhizobium sp. N113]